MKNNNPMFREDLKEKARQNTIKQLVLGNHSSMIKASCLGCKKTLNISNLSRWHKLCISNNHFL